MALIIAETRLKALRSKKELCFPDGTPVGLWRTYSPPPTYLTEPCRVIDLQDQRMRRLSKAHPK